MSDIQFGITLKADGSGIVGAVNVSKESLRQFGEEAAKAGQTTRQAFEQGQQAAARLGTSAQTTARQVGDALRSAQGLASMITTTIGAMAGFVGAVALTQAVAGIAKVFESLGSAATNAAVESIDSLTRLQAVLHATGGMAGQSMSRLEEQAQGLARATRFTDEQVRASQTTLLGYSSVSGEVFTRTIALSADMAAALGGDMATSAQRLGRALESPTEGMQALTRAGISVPPMVRAQIKELERSGNLYEAQIALLEQVESKFNGVARAMGHNMGGSLAAVNKEWGELIEDIGSSEGRVETQIKLWSTLRDVLGDIRKYAQGKESVAGAIESGLSLMSVWGASRRFVTEINRDRGAERSARETRGSASFRQGEREGLGEWYAQQAQQAQRAAEALDAYNNAIDRYDTKQQKARAEMEKLLVAWKGLTDAQRAAPGALEKLSKALEEIQRRYADTSAAKAAQKEREGIAQAELTAQEMFAKDYSEAWSWVEHYRTEEAKKGAKARAEQAEAELRSAEMAAKDSAEAWGYYYAYLESERKKAAAPWEGFVNGIEGSFRSVWDSFKNGAASAGEAARSALKRTFFDAVWQMAAKPIILNVVTSAARTIGLPGLAIAADNAAGGSGAAGLLGSAGGLFGSAGGWAAGATGLMELAGGTGLAGMASSAGMAGLGSVLGAIGAAVPYIGLAIALYSMFAKKGGGPKEGGSYNAAFSQAGSFLGARDVGGSDNGRFFTPGGADSSLATTVRGLSSSYFATLQALGGRAPGDVSFGLGFDKDPKGDAPNRISSDVTIGGRSVFGSRDRDVGRDDDQLESEMSLEAKRALLAALQASELPATVATIINSLNVRTASEEAITAALDLATAFQGILSEGGRSLGQDAATLYQAQSRTALESVRAQGVALTTLARNFDGSIERTREMAAAQTQYRNSLVQLLASIRQITTELTSMFSSTRESITTATMTDQQRYNYYQSRAQSLFGQLQTTDDPETVRSLASQINAYFNQAFGMLSPEEQATNGAAFLTNLGLLETAVTTRLGSIAAAIEEEGKAPLAAVTTALEEAANKIAAAGEDMLAAGADMRAAAADIRTASQTPQTLNVQYTGGGNAVTDGGG